MVTNCVKNWHAKLKTAVEKNIGKNTRLTMRALFNSLKRR